MSEGNPFEDDRPLGKVGDLKWMKVIAVVVILLASLIWVDTIFLGQPEEHGLANRVLRLAVVVFGGGFLLGRWRKKPR